MKHFAADFDRFIDDRVVEGFVFDIVVVVVAPSTHKDEVALHEQGQHFVEWWLHA